MFRLAAVLSLLLIGVWASGLSCDSCGSECAAACGTRHFRACCFNYLRKKRNGNDNYNKHWISNIEDIRKDRNTNKRPTGFAVQSLPEQWFSNAIPSQDFDSYVLEDMLANRLAAAFDLN